MIFGVHVEENQYRNGAQYQIVFVIYSKNVQNFHTVVHRFNGIKQKNDKIKLLTKKYVCIDDHKMAVTIFVLIFMCFKIHINLKQTIPATIVGSMIL